MHRKHLEWFSELSSTGTAGTDNKRACARRILKCFRVSEKFESRCHCRRTLVFHELSLVIGEPQIRHFAAGDLPVRVRRATHAARPVTVIYRQFVRLPLTYSVDGWFCNHLMGIGNHHLMCWVRSWLFRSMGVCDSVLRNFRLSQANSGGCRNMFWSPGGHSNFHSA